VKIKDLYLGGKSELDGVERGGGLVGRKKDF